MINRHSGPCEGDGDANGGYAGHSTEGIADQVKTVQPLILTSHIAPRDLEPFERLRQQHFPSDRNFLSAHLTMFHRLPGEYTDRIVETTKDIGQRNGSIAAKVSGVRHLGNGVAYSIESPQLLAVHIELRAAFMPWLGGQDMQKWRPHITVQNKVSRQTAGALYQRLAADFRPVVINITGLDLWRYLGGPWEHQTTTLFLGLRATHLISRGQLP
ncbi:2'-5' RNA ligase family protein [Agrobacterium vitis]|uniref:2'-5' RNA ligase family protein n=1 Tax=Agrobacterium vitis TaxID=373 RepID=A0AAE2REP0_AGRVI|nr:2'-5' RNA ligase family protein [Agrobacterium vitis]MBF2715087.1 2'-5' RNA ligase family protein [Agrobacterium vitis]